MSEPEPQPERDEPDHLAERRAKLARLREQGVEAFPHEFAGRVLIASVRAEQETLAAGAETEDSYRVAGRLAARRGHGKAAFLDLADGSGQIQLHSRADVLGAERHAGLLELDLGDVVGIAGTAFASRRGELSLRVDHWELLAKSLRPPPDKFHGLEDIETRYRRRELDLIANPDVRERFVTRAGAISEIRRRLDGDGFVEVETPVLQPLYGGALARPFTTHHNSLDRDLYLRIATELYLKRLVVGGIERVYELGKDFRNEGISAKHNPEFTMLEFYEAYADYSDAAVRLENLVAAVAEAVLGTTRAPARPVKQEAGGRGTEGTDPVELAGGTEGTDPVELAAPWRRITLREAIRDETGLDIADDPDRGEPGWAKKIDELLSKRVEPTLIQPTLVTDYPVELSPFAKSHRSEPGVVERWEAFVGGIEIANAFTELNDPDEQRRRFEDQRVEAERGDEEAQPFDEAFLAALEQGMPPTAGVGLGIDRLVMILTGASNLREVVLFPTMRG